MKEISTGESESRSVRVILAGVLAGLALGLIALFGIPDSGSGSISDDLAGVAASRSRALVGADAPVFNSHTADGKPISLADYSDQVRILNFWATWCGPCELEMPDLQARYDRWRADGFTVLAINFDEPADEVADYGREHGLDFPLVLDPGGEIQQLYQIRGYPTSYLVDRDGKILDVHIGLLPENTLDGWLSLVGLED